MNPMSWLNGKLSYIEPQARDVIEFIFLWQEYNYTYSRSVPELGDKAGALALAACPIAQRYYDSIKAEILDDFRKIPSNNVHNCPRTKLCKDSHRQREVQFNTNGHDSLEDFLKVVYQIRCNFLHGEKLWNENEEIDVKLVAWANKSLKMLLNGIGYF